MPRATTTSAQRRQAVVAAYDTQPTYVPHAPGTPGRMPAPREHPVPAPVLLVKGDSGRAQRPAGAVAAQRMDLAFDYLFGLKSDPTQVAAVDRSYWFDVLDKMGAASILEAIAGGRLPSEIAISNRVPLTFFHEWVSESIQSDALERAMVIHAEVCVIKAQLVLLADVGSPQEAAMKRDLSQQLKWQAERAHSEGWGPPGKSEPAPPALHLNINWGGMAGRPPVIEAYAVPTQQPVQITDAHRFDPFALPAESEAYADTLDEAYGPSPSESEPASVPTASFILASLPPFERVFGHTASLTRNTSERVADRQHGASE